MTKPTANDMDRYLGLRLKRGRQLVGLSAAALAEAVGSTQQQISRYENGQNKISAAQLFVLATHLGMPISWFFADINLSLPKPPEEPKDELREPPPPGYVANKLGAARVAHLHMLEDTITLQALWPMVPASQRSAVIRLLDSMINNGRAYL